MEVEPWFLQSKREVDLPVCEALTLPEDEFQVYLSTLNQWTLRDLYGKESTVTAAAEESEDQMKDADDDTFTLVSEQPSTTADIREQVNRVGLEDEENIDVSSATDTAETAPASADHPFMAGLLSFQPNQPEVGEMDNKMLTENGDIANRSTNEPLLDLFTELEDVISGPRLLELLNQAWKKDPLATLKIIFNARSIHLGKASRHTFYRCAGWLGQHHPRTLVASLPWLSRPVIEKKVQKKEDGEDDVVMAQEPPQEDDAARYDVRFGVSHGYWKDLLNLLALSVNDHLQPLAEPRDILNVEVWPDKPGPERCEVHRERHANALAKFATHPTYHALHLKVARLFAAQLNSDLATLRGNDKKKKQEISICAKWAPTLNKFHDRHTFIATSIAEIMFPVSHFPPLTVGQSRELYLRYARDEYRRALSALRAHLDIVERHLSDGTLSDIKYETVPSLAMQAYGGLFATKDKERFAEYLNNVSSGKATISGAVLLPSVLVQTARGTPVDDSIRVPGSQKKTRGRRRGKRRAPVTLEKDPEQVKMQYQVLDGQWKTLVQRVRDSGSLESCIAVCDVSGSMTYPVFKDGTCPMDSAIGLSLLMAEVVAPPFGGAFITFSESPSIQRVNLNDGLRKKVSTMRSSSWGCSTNFVAVFEDLILPMAIQNKLTQEQMVKRVFVFSDMHFNEANPFEWESSYEKIRRLYKEAGYEMAELVFWNLAGGRAGYTGYGDPIAPKPVTAEEQGVAMVSGYSQGMLKVFMDKGMFEDEEEEVVMEETTEDGVVEVVKKKAALDPLGLMRKAIGHKAYDMLEVVD
ncbi:hypothetical protein DL546_002206 [Coniochaeta pulveracea]|uniref:DUF2828 domain-containing protein n=1 Tax=Coniochaeta pulveracea TaxID=177199 RepID=A0A420XXL1_9PEZI|nr:hypothetical protein DL546_002206 [Coniochaeta pulveracea]